jgi:outer membrane protein OmpA-like peptidoglycan-associated protein
MAFNLDKNDAPAKNKFDLSKGEGIKTPEKKPNNKKTIGIVVAIVLIITVIYFLMNGSSQSSENVVTDTSVVVNPVDTASKVETNVDTNLDTNSIPKETQIIAAQFTKGSAEVNGDADDSNLKKINDYLKLDSNAVVTIEGYASSEGELNFNINLSKQRAANYTNYLISKGISAKNLQSIGKGIDNPISTNDDEIGRSKNRRVEIKMN